MYAGVESAETRPPAPCPLPPRGQSPWCARRTPRTLIERRGVRLWRTDGSTIPRGSKREARNRAVLRGSPPPIPSRLGGPAAWGGGGTPSGVIHSLPPWSSPPRGTRSAVGGTPSAVRGAGVIAGVRAPRKKRLGLRTAPPVSDATREPCRASWSTWDRPMIDTLRGGTLRRKRGTLGEREGGRPTPHGPGISRLPASVDAARSQAHSCTLESQHPGVVQIAGSVPAQRSLACVLTRRSGRARGPATAPCYCCAMCWAWVMASSA